jgi:hypothetical protein
MPGINWLAVIIAALSSFVLGGLWYSNALFGVAWRREAGDMRPGQAGHPAKVFGTAFAFALVAAAVYAWLMPTATTPGEALLQGVLVGAGLVATSYGINYQFANRSMTLWLIDGGYHTVQFALYGLIIGLWH